MRCPVWNRKLGSDNPPLNFTSLKCGFVQMVILITLILPISERSKLPYLWRSCLISRENSI